VNEHASGTSQILSGPCFVTSHQQKEKAERCTEGANNTVDIVVTLPHRSADAI
jgi:hypothetical protein